jgi:hypothetical protein
MPSSSFEPNWDRKVYGWVLVDRLTGTIREVEFADTPPPFEHEDEDTVRLVFEGYVNGGDSVEIEQRRSRLPRHNESRRIRNVRTAIWNNED